MSASPESVTPAPRIPEAPQTPDRPASRLDWLDILRLLCTIEIVGFHWLRAVFATGMLPMGMPVVHVMKYRGVDLGIQQLDHLAVNREGAGVSAIADNVLGILFGFGWEAVNVFILLSGMVLAMKYRPAGSATGAMNWFRQRVRRIVVPYYAVAIPLLLIAYAASAWLTRSAPESVIAAKIDAMLAQPLVPGLLKHIFLLDPSQDHWIASFLSPAWWFVPSILVAYLAFPALYALQARLGALPSLAGSAVLSVASYVLIQRDVLFDNAWYLILTAELASFMLGIAIGRLVREGDGAARLREIVRRPGSALLALALLAAGNLMNWSQAWSPAASIVFTPGLALLLAWVAARLDGLPAFAAASRALDPFYIYLLHQPLAFPIALIAGRLFGPWGVALGLIIYFAAVTAVTFIFQRLIMPLLGGRGPPSPASAATLVKPGVP